MTAPRFLPLLVAFALLLGQHGAQAHALSHLAHGDATKEQLAHASSCAKCSSFQQLSSVVPPSGCALVERAGVVVVHQSADAGITRTTTVPFRSRAPPLLV